VFEDVLQEVVLSVFRRGNSAPAATCNVVRVTASGMQIEPTGALVLPSDAYEPWTLARSAEDAAFVARLHAMPARLADWGYEVSTGPLVWNRHKPRLHDAAKPGRVPVVWAEAVTSDGRFVLKATRKNHRAWFEPRSNDPNLVDRPCVLVQRTTAKEQHRRLISAEMPASLFTQFRVVAIENHLNMVRPVARRPKVPLRVVAAFLATDTADRVMRCINASVAVSASELEAMPLPSPEAVLAAADQPVFGEAVRRLYGLAAA
jgi:adenine-specific DNA-methyltransferase